MNKLNILFVLVCLFVCVLGCGQGGGSTANTAATPTPEATPRPKVVDLASLVRKPMPEVVKILGGPPKRVLGDMNNWEYPQGELMVTTDYRDKKKVEYFKFTAARIEFEGRSGQGYAKYEELGDLIGFNARGKTPKQTVDGDNGEVVFEKVDLNGQPVDEIKFTKMLGSFTEVFIRPNRGY